MSYWTALVQCRCRYKLKEVIAELQNVDADIIALQEVDIGCERSACMDTGTLQHRTKSAVRQAKPLHACCKLPPRCATPLHMLFPNLHPACRTGQEIARALHMHYAFLCEFEELHSPLRDAQSQVFYPCRNALVHTCSCNRGSPRSRSPLHKILTETSQNHAGRRRARQRHPEQARAGGLPRRRAQARSPEAPSDDFTFLGLSVVHGDGISSRAPRPPRTPPYMSRHSRLAAAGAFSAITCLACRRMSAAVCASCSHASC